MGKRQKAWARKARFNLMFELGMFCKFCGAEDDLTFDCIVPMGDKHHRSEMSSRICFYRAQHKSKNIQVLCAKCNEEKSKRHMQVLLETQPF